MIDKSSRVSNLPYCKDIPMPSLSNETFFSLTDVSLNYIYSRIMRPTNPVALSANSKQTGTSGKMSGAQAPNVQCIK